MRDMGIVVAKPDGKGDMLRMQTFSRLLAGGIYQNRERMDKQHMSLVEEVAALKDELAIANQKLQALSS